MRTTKRILILGALLFLTACNAALPTSPRISGVALPDSVGGADPTLVR